MHKLTFLILASDDFQMLQKFETSCTTRAKGCKNRNVIDVDCLSDTSSPSKSITPRKVKEDPTDDIEELVCPEQNGKREKEEKSNENGLSHTGEDDTSDADEHVLITPPHPKGECII